MKMKLRVKNRFYITTTADGELNAEKGDTLDVEERNDAYFNIKRLNDKPIFLRWMRKPYVLGHCERQR